MLGVSNEDMLSNMEVNRFNNAIGTWTVNINTGLFYIIVNPITGQDQLDHIKNATKVMIELYDHGRMPNAEELDMSDVILSDDDVLKFNARCFPHHGIYPQSDLRFKDQPWATLFNLQGFLTATGSFTLDELCAVVRYCVKFNKLKAFL